MGLLQALFGNQQQAQPGWQGQMNYQQPAQDVPPQSLIQSILAARQQPQQQPAQNAQGIQPQQVTSDFLNAINQSIDPSYSDIGNAAISRFVKKDPTITAQSMAVGRITPQLEMLKSLSESNRNNALAANGGSSGSTILAARTLMQENPNLSFADAFSMAKSGLGQGVTYGDGTVKPMQGAPQAAGAMAAGKETGQKGVELQYAAPIEAAKMSGRGEIRPTEQLSKGQNQLSKVIGDISSYYDDLDSIGTAVSTQNSAGMNALNYMRNSSAGQMLGKIGGTNEQSIRNEINQAIPNLINAIRSSTGMSAKAMDSNAELKFYLQQATDPTLDIQANKAALARIQSMYGTGGAGGQSMGTTSAQPQNIEATQNLDGIDYVKINGEWHQK